MPSGCSYACAQRRCVSCSWQSIFAVRHALLVYLLATHMHTASADVVVRYIPERLWMPPRIAATTALALFITPLSFGPSLASGRILYSTWLSVATYIAWFACVSYLHAHGSFIQLKEPHPPSLWQGLSTLHPIFRSLTHAYHVISRHRSVYIHDIAHNPPVCCS